MNGMDQAINKTCGVPYMACIVEWCVFILLMILMIAVIGSSTCVFAAWVKEKIQMRKRRSK